MSEKHVWVIEVGHKHDRGIYRIYTNEKIAREVFDLLLKSNEWGDSPILSQWSLDMPYKLKNEEKCFKQIFPGKRDDIPFSKFEWES